MGYRIDTVEITDPMVLEQSGGKCHPLSRFSCHARKSVARAAFAVSQIDLAAGDPYEVTDYHRVGVSLLSGLMTWVYVDKNA